MLLQAGTELAGTLKNIVALAAGIVDGVGAGQNSKAAIMRQGLHEMQTLAAALYPTVRSETFMESCGVADLIASCYGGRNRRVAAAWASAHVRVRCPHSARFLFDCCIRPHAAKRSWSRAAWPT